VELLSQKCAVIHVAVEYGDTLSHFHIVRAQQTTTQREITRELKSKNNERIVKMFVLSYTFTFTFTFRAFGRRFSPKRLTKSTFVEGDSNISQWYIKKYSKRTVYSQHFVSAGVTAAKTIELK